MLNNKTGLYYLQSRYYDPSVRRFINADEFEIIGKTDFLSSYNLYVYCDNSPIGKSDAKGNAATKWVGVGVQFQISTKSYSIGIEIIWFGDKTICGKNHVTKAYAYAFYSGNTNGNAETIWKYVIPKNNPLQMIQGFLEPKVDLSFVAVFSNGTLKNPSSYAGFSGTISTTIWYVCVGVSYSDSGYTVSAGYCNPPDLDFNTSYTKSRYLKKDFPPSVNNQHNYVKSNARGWGIV